MNATAAAFRAYFSRSALLDIRGTGVAFVYGLLLILEFMPGGTNNTGRQVFWSVLGGVMLAQQYSQFLHRLTGSAAARLIPDYRRIHWNAFLAVGIIAMAFDSILFRFAGLTIAGAFGAVVLVFGVSVWANFKSPFLNLALFATAFIFMFGGAANPAVTWLQQTPLWPAAAATLGVLALWGAGQHYLGGGRIAIGVKLDRRSACRSGLRVDWRFLASIDHRLFGRLLRRQPTAGNEIGRLVAGSYTAVWGSGVSSLILYFACAGFIWLINSAAAWLVHGNVDSHSGIAVPVGFLMVSVMAASTTAAQFGAQRRQWPQYWLALPAVDRRAWTGKLAGAFLLVQVRSFIAAGAGLIGLAVVAGYSDPVKLGLTLAVGLDVFLLLSAIALIMLPLADGLGVFRRLLLFGLLATASSAVGFVIFLSLGHMLPLAGRAGAGLAGVGIWSTWLILLGLRRLPGAELAVRGAGAQDSLWGF
ncbi:MAG TPA: hypothetical protein VFH85_01615 [Gammaproteobacteria bacterium]|nr:hypothetical protein [Gammaproteobacteria bacterium]